MFCYLDFRSYLKANNDPSRFHFVLKVLLPWKFIAKSTYRFLKRALKKNNPIIKYDQSRVGRKRKIARNGYLDLRCVRNNKNFNYQ